MKFPIDKDDAPLKPGWSIKWSPRKMLEPLLYGDFVVRYRPDHSSKVLFTVPIGGEGGCVPIEKADEFGEELLKLLRKYKS